MTTDRVHAIVRGRVQGVGFRYAACAEARRLGLRGWVRNLPDGSVETCAEGPPASVAAYCEWLASGPTLARVAGVASVAPDPSPLPDPFAIW